MASNESRKVSALLFVFMLAVAACGGDSDGPPTGPPTDPPDDPPSSGPVETTSVDVLGATFDPEDIQVSPGATVTWTWNSGGVQHNVTWASADLSDSPTQGSGTFEATMPSTTGELVYYCTIHGTPSSGMRGTVLVDD